MNRKRVIAVLVTVYVVIQALLSIVQLVTPDIRVERLVSQHGYIGDCFDGTYEDYNILQYAYAPRIIDWNPEGCP